MGQAARLMRVYIAGPMTGYPAWNYPAFYAAEDRWTEMGHTPLNPARHFGGRTDLPREVYLRAAAHALLEADAIALLDGWQYSPGARWELDTARNFGLEVFDAQTGLLVEEGTAASI